ncbi:MAG: hypothetical protein JRI53_09975 [Deltaproteobacteria bacterium]|nr:hypothetical protein [Deltaproteobacteria bacterium]MBW1848937.1 hypothetical protein [Deltaproteobacteria bacterium]MBW1985036.1 hypothetical protein [Deltaproteobacteria bacterium]
MNTCSHANLIQLPQPEKKLRCQHCHLTIKADELKQGYCPECFEMNGDKRYEFETIDVKEPAATQYKCEDCGVIIESE